MCLFQHRTLPHVALEDPTNCLSQVGLCMSTGASDVDKSESGRTPPVPTPWGSVCCGRARGVWTTTSELQENIKELEQ